MYCKRCGEEFQGKECPSCGQIHGDAQPDGMDATSSVFLEADESLVSQMSRGYLSNLVLGGTLSSDFVILSDRRVYYSGSYIGRVGTGVAKLTGQIILPLQKVTSVSFLDKKSIALLILGFFFLIPGLAIAALDAEGFLALMPSVGCFVAYHLTIKRFFRLGGHIVIHVIALAARRKRDKHRSIFVQVRNATTCLWRTINNRDSIARARRPNSNNWCQSGRKAGLFAKPVGDHDSTKHQRAQKGHEPSSARAHTRNSHPAHQDHEGPNFIRESKGQQHNGQGHKHGLREL